MWPFSPLPLLGDRWLTADFPPALNDELRSRWKVIANATGPKNLQAKSTDRKQFLTVMRTTFQCVAAFSQAQPDLHNARYRCLAFAAAAGAIQSSGPSSRRR